MDHAFVGDPQGVEFRQIDAAVNDPDLLGRHMVGFLDLAGDEVGNGDHPLAPGHHLVVKPLEDRMGGIGPMHGGHEVRALEPCRRLGAPRRGPRTGMDDIDAVIADQTRQPVDVGAHDERVLGIKRQGYMPGPGAIDKAHHRPAGGSDEGAPPGAGDGGGDIGRAPLDPARDQPRQDLEHRRPIGFGAAAFDGNLAGFVAHTHRLWPIRIHHCNKT